MKAKNTNKADVAPAQSGQPTPDTGIASRGELIEEINRLHDCEQQTTQHVQNIIDGLLKDKADLLEALRNLIEVPEVRQEDMQQARAAIAKAEGNGQ